MRKLIVLAAATAFATGTSWGTMGILIPLAVPTAFGMAQAAGFDPTSASSTPDLFSTIRTAVEFRFVGLVGEIYRIEGSTDLDEWTVIEDNIAGTGGTTARFYSTEEVLFRAFRARKN